MADFVWNPFVLTPGTAGPPILQAMNTSGGRNFLGAEQIIGNDAGYWKITFSDIRLMTRDQILYWNALSAGLRGRAKTILVPVLDQPRGPFPIIGGKRIYGTEGVPFSDGSLFDDGEEFATPEISAVMVGDVAPGAVTAQIKIIAGDVLQGGQHWSVSERLYRIVEVTATDTSGDYPIYTVLFAPNAREAIPDATDLEFDNPQFRCRLATDNEMQTSLQMFKFGQNPTVNFIED